MVKSKNIIILISALFLGGCAHQITINPNMESFQESANKVDTVVGYHISEQDLAKKVTTPGGGGDKVSYSPYKDTESVFYAVLSNKFKDVFTINSLEDKEYIKQNNIQLIFIPEIVTNSSSSSMLKWPPTKFIINLALKVIDSDGKTVWEKALKAEGNAEFDEFKSDFSLSARRATEKVYTQLVEELENIELNQ